MKISFREKLLFNLTKTFYNTIIKTNEAWLAEYKSYKSSNINYRKSRPTFHPNIIKNESGRKIQYWSTQNENKTTLKNNHQQNFEGLKSAKEKYNSFYFKK